MPILCPFCNKDAASEAEGGFRPTQSLYFCPRCGQVHLTTEAITDFNWDVFSEKEKKAISITLRNEWERRNRKSARNPITFQDLERMVKSYKPLSPLEKMDHALLIFEKSTIHAGGIIQLNLANDYPLFHCDEPGELRAICKLLFNEGLITGPDPANPQSNSNITVKGYQRIKEIQKAKKDSRQCFVAMWFSEEMNEAFEKAIKPAIEFIEKGETSPRFDAIKIDNVEHINDINDEIIGQIRRSKFMVCDLTGYRGGVYFEAGFAYGLGIDVIYTCRQDWTKEELLKNKDGEVVPYLFDADDNRIPIKKEGVHFDLAHRNRIEWSQNNLEEFKIKLENRIKAVIY